MNRSQLVFGLLFVTVGLLLLAEQAGWVSAWTVIAEGWPTIVIVAGIAQLTLRPRNPIGGVTTLMVGGALLLYTLGVVDTLALLWPVLLIALGAWLLFARPSGRSRGPGPIVDVVAVIDDRREIVPAGPFSGGAVTTVFGDVALDLTSTTLGDGRATLQVTTVFGDVEVAVPAGWEVTVNGPEIFGSVDVPPPVITGQRREPTGTGVLHLRTVLVFGDVTVRTSARRTDGSAVGSIAVRP